MTEGNEVLEEQVTVFKRVWRGMVSKGLERFRRERSQWWEIFGFKLSNMGVSNMVPNFKGDLP